MSCKHFIFYIVALLLDHIVLNGQNISTIEIKESESYSRDSANIKCMIINYPQFNRQLITNIKTKKVNNFYKWILNIDEPKHIWSDSLLGKNITYVIEPGDSISVELKNGSIYFSGRGASKFNLIYQLKNTVIQKPKNDTNRVKDYLEFSLYTDSLIEYGMHLLDSFKTDLSPFAYKYLESRIITEPDYDRSERFMFLTLNSKHRGRYNWTNIDKVRIYDSTIANSPFKRMHYSDTSAYIVHYSDNLFYRFMLEYARSKEFNLNYLDSPELDRKVDEYFYAKYHSEGLARQRLLYFILTWSVVSHGGGLTPEAMDCVEDFLSIPGYPEYKKALNEFIVKTKTISKGQFAPDFTLTDINGKTYSLKELKGKIVLMDFWFTGCKPCIKMAASLSKVKSKFMGNKSVAFLNICVDSDKDRWMKSVNDKKYTDGIGINVFTNGRGANHDIISNYNINSYPRIYLLDHTGAIVNNPLPNPIDDNGLGLINIINMEIVEQFDGPYVSYTPDKVCVKSVIVKSGERHVQIDSFSIENRDLINLKVQTDEIGKTFSFPLKKAIYIEKSEYDEPSKIIALSDIEGNFRAFRMLLQKNGVIDEDYNWVFKNGHLVLVGDFFDRGEQVTECLWLIYSLEEKAKRNGGYVHFILGNHEILNLTNSSNYVQAKYKLDNIHLLKEKYNELYNSDTELGRWLRTKNIVERIGDKLFVHGGISTQINNLNLSLNSINEIARPFYDASVEAIETAGEEVRVLFSSRYSPFWYRHYYKETSVYSDGAVISKANQNQIDSTLKKFNVSKIITGHTIIRPGHEITSFYGDKVINIDTEHSNGSSEALLIEFDNYYRVNTIGKRHFLFSNRLNISSK